MTHPLATYMKRYFSHYLAVQKGLASNTILSYRDSMKLLLCFAADRIKKPVDKLAIEDIDEPCVLAFLDDLEEKRGCKPRTRNVRLAAIRTFFGFIAREEPSLLPQCQKIHGIPLKRTEHRTIEYLEEKEMQAVLDSVDVNSRTGIRDKALLLLLYNTGARASEIVGLRIADLRLDSIGQVKLLGKGKKQRSCPLWPETVEIINTYLRQRAPKDGVTDTLFLNANGEPITRFGIRYITRKYGAAAGAKSASLKSKAVNPHTIRHTTAMHLLRSGNEINMISRWLGHADCSTTHIYVEIDMEMKRKMLEKADAPTVKKRMPWNNPKILEWLSSLAARPKLCAAT